MNNLKLCKTCNEVKLIEEFHIHKRAKDGLRRTCKTCSTTKTQDRRIARSSVSSDEKLCGRCLESKALDSFYTHQNGKPYSHCIQCSKKDNDDGYSERGWQTTRQIKDRESHLLRTYGITSAQYNELLEKQNHCCAICLRHEREFNQRLAVDHDHHTNEIRGLACTHCNHRIIGRHRDGEMLRRLANYVEQGTGWYVPLRNKKKKSRDRKAK